MRSCRSIKANLSLKIGAFKTMRREKRLQIYSCKYSQKARCDFPIFCLHISVSGLNSSDTHVWPITREQRQQKQETELCLSAARRPNCLLTHPKLPLRRFESSLPPVVLFEEAAFRLGCPLLTSESTNSFMRSGWGCGEALGSTERRGEVRSPASSWVWTSDTNIWRCSMKATKCTWPDGKHKHAFVWAPNGYLSDKNQEAEMLNEDTAFVQAMVVTNMELSLINRTEWLLPQQHFLFFS